MEWSITKQVYHISEETNRNLFNTDINMADKLPMELLTTYKKDYVKVFAER